MRIRRLVAAGVLAVAVLVAGVTPAGATPASAAASSAVCERLRERMAEVPGIRARIQRRVDGIEDRLAAVRNPRRRARLTARLQPRLASLRALDARLAQQVARAQARCSRTT